MNDTVTRLMALADKAIDAQALQLGCLAQDYLQALQDELQKLFTPLSDEQIKQACKETWIFDTAKQWVRSIEAAHGIK